MALYTKCKAQPIITHYIGRITIGTQLSTLNLLHHYLKQTQSAPAVWMKLPFSRHPMILFLVYTFVCALSEHIKNVSVYISVMFWFRARLRSNFCRRTLQAHPCQGSNTSHCRVSLTCSFVTPVILSKLTSFSSFPCCCLKDMFVFLMSFRNKPP